MRRFLISACALTALASAAFAENTIIPKAPVTGEVRTQEGRAANEVVQPLTKPTGDGSCMAGTVSTTDNAVNTNVARKGC